MPSIIFLPDNQKKIAKENQTILEVAQQLNIPLTHVCMGNARCSTCRILIVEGIENVSPRSESEQDIAIQMGFSSNIRLACQSKIIGDIIVRRLVLDDEDIELTNLLIANPNLNLVGVETHVLILFSDIRGFTALSETLLPYDVVHILNRYFHMMNKVIMKHGGSIINYMGDSFVALFEIKTKEKDMLHGVMAALEMLDVVNKQFQPYIKKLFYKDFKIGIGLHYGLVIAGTIGSYENGKYSIIGDAVNFTSRIESSNKLLGTQLLISEDVYNYVHKSIRVNKTPPVAIPGKTGTYTFYEVLGFI
jgi:adenylate cyclase